MTYWDRLRSRPLTSEEIAKVGFLDMTAATQTLLTSYTGGGKPTISWTRPANAAPALSAAYFHGAFGDSQGVKLSDTSAEITCTLNSNCNPDGTYRPGMNFILTGFTTFAAFQLTALNKHGTQIFSQYSR